MAITRTSDHRHASSVAGESRQFTIEASATAFRILVDQLYANKIAAVVREVVSNAYDAMSLAGSLAAPQVALPSMLSPQFVVRDYGVGMDDDTVMDVYTTLFASTKRDTNSAQGKLGLGAKSPFAYTDAFTLRCWDGSSERIYHASIDASGTPVMQRVAEIPSAERRGCEVTVPVRPGDYRKFEYCFDAFLHGVPVGVEVPSGFLRPVPTHAGDGWALYDSSNLEVDVYARMGTVLYRIEPQHLPMRLGGSQSLVVDFPVGSLDVLPSREGLSYDELTIRELTGGLVAVREFERQRFEVILDGMSAWDSLNSRTDLRPILNAFNFGASEVSIDVYSAVTGNSSLKADFPPQARRVVRTTRKRSDAKGYVSSHKLFYVKPIGALVDHGTYLVRKDKRISNLYPQADSPEFRFTVDPHRSALQNVMALAYLCQTFEIPLSDLTSVASLPDIPPAPRSQAPRVARPSRKEPWSPGEFWGVRAVDSQPGSLKFSRTDNVIVTSNVDEVTRYIGALTGVHTVVRSLTSKQVRDLNPDPNMEIGGALVRATATVTDARIDQLIRVPNEVYSGYMHRMLTDELYSALGVDDGPVRSDRAALINVIAMIDGNRLRDARVRLREQADRAIATIQAKYPMLHRPSDSDIRHYIKSVRDAQSADTL